MNMFRGSLSHAPFKRMLPFSGSRFLGTNSGSADAPSPKSCLILGATSSISFEVIRHLLGRGVRVLATGRDESRLKELQSMGAITMQVHWIVAPAAVSSYLRRILILFVSLRVSVHVPALCRLHGLPTFCLTGRRAQK
jgi:hypothetical protein